jgi:suppressor of G2 allele of SKP1
MSSQAALGLKALEVKDYTAAIKHYSDALKSSKSPLWLIQRSTAYQRSGQHESALYDAEDALLEAISRGRRELMADAQMRRAIALYGLGRYGDARLCFTFVRKLSEKEKGLGMWQAKVVQEFDKLDEGAEGRRTTIKEIPDKVERAAPKESQPEKTAVGASQATSPAAVAPSAPSTAQTPKEKIRHEWFQSGNKVTITIFAKNVPKDKVDIQFTSDSLEVSFPTSSGSSYDLSILPLFSNIDVSQSKYSVTPNKIEISLHKAIQGVKWSALEGVAGSTTASQPATFSAVTASVPAPGTSQRAPSYPTSSKKGAQNWDAVAKAELEKARKEASKDSKDKDSAPLDDDLDDEADPLNGFFKKIYKDADPDTRRAMMKSFVESNGTALSTNWADVGKAPVPVNPPDGVEARKWDS